MRFLTTQQIRDFEGRVITEPDASLKLIDNAARTCVKELTPFDASCVFCGKGNNGADGYRTAELLKKLGRQVSIVSVFEPATPECRLLADNCRRAGIEITPFADLRERPRCDAVVDAIFGIGIKGEVTGPARAAIEYINSMDAFILSADVPSGLDADTGEPCGCCVRADKTVTFTAPKVGMINNASVEPCGEIIIRDAGIPVNWDGIPASQPLTLTPEYAASLLPRRPRLSHKGTFGRLLTFVGSPGMMGAASMALRGALRGGCGLVTAVCRSGSEPLLNLMVPQAVALPTERLSLRGRGLASAVTTASSILMGCGSGRDLTPEFIDAVAGRAKCPITMDADALNVLAERGRLPKKGDLLITPHPMEFSRLTGLSVSELEADRLGAARSFAAESGATVLLKGARTVIARPDGEAAVSLISTSALAKGGSGDILAGLIASLCAQGLKTHEAAELGVWLHGRSGVISGEKCGEYSVTADDIIENLKYSFTEAIGHGKSRQGLG